MYVGQQLLVFNKAFFYVEESEDLRLRSINLTSRIKW